MFKKKHLNDIKCPICSVKKVIHIFDTKDCTPNCENTILHVHQCGNCRNVFLYPFPSEQGEQFFQEAYKNGENHYYFDNSYKEKIASIRLKILSNYIDKREKILDIGCGKGFFLKVALKEKWCKVAEGIELDKSASEYAINNSGLMVYNNKIEEINLRDKYYDVITLWDVIEHVENPLKLLNYSYNLLKENGVIVIRTGNIDCFDYINDPQNWFLFSVGHNFYFSTTTISHIISKANFRDIKIFNFEPTEKKETDRDVQIDQCIDETPFYDGIKAVLKDPRKLQLIPLLLKTKYLRAKCQKRFGVHFSTTIMTVIAKK